MVDQIVGLLLFGLGIHTNLPGTPNVKGDQTVATSSVSRAAAIREDRKEFMESLKERRTEAREHFASREAQLKEKLQLMKDRKKAALIERINEKCQNINEKRTDSMSKMLEKMSSILENVGNRTSSASANGKDTSSVDTAIAAAHTTITDAQSAVAVQAGTKCVVTVNSETTAKNDVGTAISGLEKNLKIVFDKVIAAKRSVGAAIKALGLVLGESV